MTARIAWMRCRTGVARHAERAAPFRTAQNAADQNSAGRYPLISSPMQISTRVGVLQAIGRPFSAFLNEHVKSARAGAQAPQPHGRTRTYSAREFYCRPSHGAPRDNSSGVSLKPIRCLEAPATSLSP
jgi:hypothetical protein